MRTLGHESPNNAATVVAAAHVCNSGLLPAVLKVKIKFKLNSPRDPDRNQANIVDLRRQMAVRTLPRAGAAKIKIKSVLKYN